jgi:hypothetical protein
MIFATTLGLITYMGCLRTYFFWDDVDLFAGLCRAASLGKSWDWIWAPVNGHFMPLPKVLYWAIDTYFDRNAAVWQGLNLILHGITVVSIVQIFAQILKDRRLVWFLSCLYAVSPIYWGTIVDSNTMNHHLGITLALVAWAQLFNCKENPQWGRVILALCLGSLAAMCSALGGIGLGLMPLFVLVYYPRFKLSITGLFTIAALTCFFITVNASSHSEDTQIDILFGFTETGRALVEYHWPNFVRGLGLPLVILALVGTLMTKKQNQWGPLICALTVMVLPLFLSLIFRSEFNRPGNWSRYHHLPVVGTLWWVGYGLTQPNIQRWWLGFTKRRAVSNVFLAIPIILGLWGSVEIFNMPDRHLMRQYEQVLFRAIEEYAAVTKKAADDPVLLPNINTRLPNYPHQRKLPYVACYIVPASKRAHLRIESGKSNFMDFVSRNPRFNFIAKRIVAPR